MTSSENGHTRPHLIIYRGLPGSGKSHEATMDRFFVGGGSILGRDDIRFMMFGPMYKQNYNDEQFVTRVQEMLIREALRKGEHVFVDDMNLRPKYVKRFRRIAAEMNVNFRIRDLTNVDLEVCIQRDAYRERTVGEDVIRDLHQRFVHKKGYPLEVPELDEPEVHEPITTNTTGPKAVIVDIDGTVALHVSGRSPYDMSRVLEDAPNDNVIQIVESLYEQGYKILFTTARTEEARMDTFKWLSHHVNIGAFSLFMRQSGDYRKDAIVKKEIYENKILPHFNVVAVLDDRNAVVEMWRDIGLTCLQVAEGNF